MNLKKYLRQQAEKDAESLLTDDDRQFSMQLAQSAQQTLPKRKRFNFAAISSVVATCLVAIILGITLPLTINKQPAIDEIFYNEENVAQTACTLEDVNYNSKYFKIEETESITFRYQLNYDSVTGDKLYYSVSVTGGIISTFTLDIVINENYNYNFEMYGEILNGQLSQYSVEYNSQIEEGVMSTELKYKGIIKVESEIVYIDYKQSFEIGDQAFFEDIQNVLKVKN